MVVVNQKETIEQTNDNINDFKIGKNIFKIGWTNILINPKYNLLGSIVDTLLLQAEGVQENHIL